MKAALFIVLGSFFVFGLILVIPKLEAYLKLQTKALEAETAALEAKQAQHPAKLPPVTLSAPVTLS